MAATETCAVQKTLCLGVRDRDEGLMAGSVSRRPRGILGRDLRCIRRSGRIYVRSASRSRFYVAATPGTGPKAGEKNSSLLERLSIKLWLHVHGGDSLKEMCARSVVVCCSSHP